MITEENIFHIRRPKNTSLWGNRAKIIFVMPITSLLQIKFSSEKRSILLYFQENRREALEYMIPDCAKVAGLIQRVLERNGFYVKRRSAAMEKARSFGLELCSEIKQKQKSLGSSPSFDQVEEIINLHCLAAEKLEYARDERYSEVISHMSRFLAKPKISTALRQASNVQASALLKMRFSTDSAALSDISSLTTLSQSFSSSRSLDDQSRQSLDELVDHDVQGSEEENYPLSENSQEKGYGMGYKKPTRLAVRGRDSPSPEGRIPFQRRIVI